MWSRVLVEKLTPSQLLKKFPTFYGNRKVYYRIQKCLTRGQFTTGNGARVTDRVC
jgi:hypothetical protein